MDVYTKESGIWISTMELAHSAILLTITLTQESIKMTKDTVKAPSSGKMVTNTVANGKTASTTAKVFSSGQTIENTKVITPMAKKKVKALSPGPKVRYM